MKTTFRLFLFAVLLILLAVRAVSAETATTYGRTYHFTPSAELRPQVDFWKLIFTKYGKDHVVIHYRDYPQVIYAVLDVSEYTKKYDGRKLTRIKSQIVETEIADIRQSLRHLAGGGRPRNDLETRMEGMFQGLGGDVRMRYRHAMEEKQIRYQTGIRERFMEGLQRSGRYLYAIEEIFRDRGLPAELGQLPFVESSFDYNAYSSVGAAGIWQFMRSTGSRYLRINAALDERRDAIQATRAATMYLAHAYNQIGSWPLAITSYNHGIAGIVRAVKQVGSYDIAKIIRRYDSRSFGFASKNFYAEFLAALEVARDKESYFPGLKIEQPWYFDEIRLGAPLTVSEITALSGVSREEIKQLNTAFLRPILEGGASVPRGYFLKLHRGAGAQFCANHPSSRVISLREGTGLYVAHLKGEDIPASSDEYVVKKGDTISGIARRFSVSQDDLLSLNRLKNPRSLRLGMTLKIPDYSKQSAAAKVEVRQSTAQAKIQSSNVSEMEYVVRGGDTVGSIARRFGISERELMQQNGISDAKRLRAGSKVRIRKTATSRSGAGEEGKDLIESAPVVAPKVEETVSVSIGSEAPQSYTVNPGDTLSSIARKLSVPQKELITANRISNPALLRVGMKLTVPGQVVASGESNGGSSATFAHVVQKGENLSKIARRYGTTLKEIRKLNPALSDMVRPGQEINVPR